MKTLMDMRKDLLQRRREAYFQQRAWWWPSPSGMIKVGIIGGLGGCWIVGHVTENGSHKKLNSAVLAKHMPCQDPETLLRVVILWSISRTLKEVEWDSQVEEVTA